VRQWLSREAVDSLSVLHEVQGQNAQMWAEYVGLCTTDLGVGLNLEEPSFDRARLRAIVSRLVLEDVRSVLDVDSEVGEPSSDTSSYGRVGILMTNVPEIAGVLAGYSLDIRMHTSGAFEGILGLHGSICQPGQRWRPPFGAALAIGVNEYVNGIWLPMFRRNLDAPSAISLSQVVGDWLVDPDD
jgi:hypothetical protein